MKKPQAFRVLLLTGTMLLIVLSLCIPSRPPLPIEFRHKANIFLHTPARHVQVEHQHLLDALNSFKIITQIAPSSMFSSIYEYDFHLCTYAFISADEFESEHKNTVLFMGTACSIAPLPARICESILGITYFDHEQSPRSVCPSVKTAYLPFEHNSPQFPFYLARALFFFDVIPYAVLKQAPLALDPHSRKIVLSMPESGQRNHAFHSQQPTAAEFTPFQGYLHPLGWIGCALSYSLLAKAALHQSHQPLLIVEDDVVFPANFDAKFRIIQAYLDKTPGWDLFSGLISDVPADTRVENVEFFQSIMFVTLTRFTSTVFNVYSERALRALTLWNLQKASKHKCCEHTIDRYLSHFGMRVVVALPFLVEHRSSQSSTLWEFDNTQYDPMIENSQRLLLKMAVSWLMYEQSPYR